MCRAGQLFLAYSRKLTSRFQDSPPNFAISLSLFRVIFDTQGAHRVLLKKICCFSMQSIIDTLMARLQNIRLHTLKDWSCSTRAHPRQNSWSVVDPPQRASDTKGARNWHSRGACKHAVASSSNSGAHFTYIYKYKYSTVSIMRNIALCLRCNLFESQLSKNECDS